MLLPHGRPNRANKETRMLPVSHRFRDSRTATSAISAAESGPARSAQEYFKPAEMIVVRQQYVVKNGETGEESTQGGFVTLAEKIYELTMEIGYPKDVVRGVVINLLASGKVALSGQDYLERLELQDDKDKVSEDKAAELFTRYLSVFQEESPVRPEKEMTMRIVVQPPRKD